MICQNSKHLADDLAKFKIQDCNIFNLDDIVSLFTDTSISNIADLQAKRLENDNTSKQKQLEVGCRWHNLIARTHILYFYGGVNSQLMCIISCCTKKLCTLQMRIIIYPAEEKWLNLAIYTEETYWKQNCLKKGKFWTWKTQFYQTLWTYSKHSSSTLQNSYFSPFFFDWKILLQISCKIIFPEF